MPIPEALADLLKTFQFAPIKEDLYDTIFTDDNVKEISECLAQNLIWGGSNDDAPLVIESKGISDSGAIPLLDIRLPGKNITHLSIMINQLGDKFIKELSNRITLNAPYIGLSIGGMNITEEGLIALAKSLTTNKSIKTLVLYFDSSQIKPEALIQYLILLSKNTSIDNFQSMGGESNTYEFNTNRELGKFFKNALEHIASRNKRLANVDNPVTLINEVNKFSRELIQHLKEHQADLINKLSLPSDFDPETLLDNIIPPPSLLSQTIFKVKDLAAKEKISAEQIKNVPDELKNQIKKGNN